MALVGRLDDLIRRGGLEERLLFGLSYLAELGEGFLAGEAAGFRSRVELEEGVLAAIHQVYETRPAGQVRMEAHRRFADIQYLHAGEEAIHIAPLWAGRLAVPYDAEQDVAFYDADSATEILLGPGMAAVLLPEDLHAPGLHLAGRALVRKTVVKAVLRP